MYPLTHSRRRSPAGVSVAELVSLHATADVPRNPAAATAPPISVASLLRREGRGPHAVDPPLLPRARDRAEPPAPRRGVRKAAAAAGSLFAATAVFGATVLGDATRDTDADRDDVSATPGDDRAVVLGGPGAGSGLALATEAVPLPPVFDPGSVLPAASRLDIGRVAPTADAPRDAGGLPMDRTAPAAGTRPDPAAPAGPGAPATGPGAPATVPAPAGPEPSEVDSLPGDPADLFPTDPSAAGPAPTDPTSIGPSPAAEPSPAAGPGTTAPLVRPDGPGTDGPVTVLAAPDVRTPAVTLPAVTLSAADVETPELTTDDEDGLRVAVSRTAVDSPDVRADAVDAGPVGVTDTAASPPDVTVESDAPLLSVGTDEAPEITVPEVRVSEAELTTPDARLGETVVEVPDLATPELTVPETPLLRTLLGGQSGT